MNNKKFFIIRHGNTFMPNDEILRVGKRTDLPLSLSGIQQIEKLAKYININNIHPDIIISSNLKRTIQTGAIINQSLPITAQTQQLDVFDEIDYGVFDGMAETKVQTLIPDELQLWETKNIMPSSWSPSAYTIINNLTTFFTQSLLSPQINNFMIITSNGIAKFIPKSLGIEYTSSKLSTGSISLIEYTDNTWNIKYWNYTQ